MAAPTPPVVFDDLQAKKRILFAHIHGNHPSALYLDEQHIDWMSDIVLQHVLADLRPLIIPKLQAEKDVHFGPGATPGNKRGIVEVHRGEAYQFAYFFRKTEPHTVLLKSRHFVTAPVPSRVAPKSTPARAGNRNPQQKRLGTQLPAKKRKRERSEPRGKKKVSRDRVDEDEWSPEESEEDMDTDNSISGGPRPMRKQHRRIVTDASSEDDDDIKDTYVPMNSPALEMDEGSNENSNVSVDEDRDPVPRHANDEPSDIELVVEDEEEKPKPLLKLKYQSFTISGHCLCVVVEPWPPLVRAKGLVISLQCGALNQSLLPRSGPVATEQRAKTPLFLPEYDRAPSEAPFKTGKTLPVPLFNDEVSAEADDYSNDDLVNFSQTLNAGGQMYTIPADDDDDMDGAVLFGDADEVRELF